ILRRVPLIDPARDSLRPVMVNQQFRTVQALPNGRYLVSGWGDWVVREVDVEGNVVWRSPRKIPCRHPSPLPTGTLLANASTRVVELARGGQVVWEAFSLGGDVRFVAPCLNLVRLGFDAPRPADFDLERSVEHRIKGLRNKSAWVRYSNALMLEKMGEKA